RHGDGHFIQRDAVEQNAHVQDGVDGHACFAHIADDALVVGVVAAVGGQVEGDGEAALPGGEVAAVEGVALFGGAVPGILAHGPRLHGVHGGVGAAQVGWNP